MNYKITPKNLILSIFQVSELKTIPIKALAEIGRIFGFADSTVRVTVTRLIREGAIESDERGMYHLSMDTTPFQRFLDTWRLGEHRIKPWDGRWLCYLSQPLPARRRQTINRALGMLGFREGYTNLWVRTNNLNMEMDHLRQVLIHRDVDASPFLFIAGDLESAVTRQWQEYLWPVDQIREQQNMCLEKLEKSAGRITRMPSKNALVESYLMGSEAVNLLINDPLLPLEIMENKHRVALTKAMLNYDDLGKSIWKEQFISLKLQQTPSLLQSTK